ncbi:MAG: NAD(P)H-binding protein [Myxococcota bacterium]|jgi:NADH dehydrogenase|nr:NAD(P)H-binding protein [Myxococcota bacterium]
MPSDPRPVLVTGANGQIALQLFERLAQRGVPGRALVRSERAAKRVAELPDAIRPQIEVLDEALAYSDAPGITRAAAGCRAIVHLVGILKEGSNSSYRTAHEESCAAVAEAADANELDRVVYLSIFGSHPTSSNACLASKGRAEEILMRAKTPATVLRVPMVVGPDDPASRALRAQATKDSVTLVGGGESIHQPIDVRDLLEAILAALYDPGSESRGFDLGGPEALPYRDLVTRAAALYGKAPRVRKIPVGLMKLVAAVMEKISKDPPITRAMLGVLEHDDHIDNRTAIEHLAIGLTPLDDTLGFYLGPKADSP